MESSPRQRIHPMTRLSYMYQSAGHSAIRALADCLGVPLIRRPIAGSARCQSLEYAPSADDEVEDLLLALQEAQRQFPDLEAVSSGAIVSNYQRVRVEHVCLRLGLQPMALLWQRDRGRLLSAMLDAGVEAVLVKVAGAGLDPELHLGRSLRTLYPTLLRLHDKYGLDLCGEGGEYESLVLDSPLFRRRLVIDESEVVLDGENASVGNLRILRCHCEDKHTAPRIPPPPPKLSPPLGFPETSSITEETVYRSSASPDLLGLRALQRLYQTPLMMRPSHAPTSGTEAGRQLRQLLDALRRSAERRSLALSDAVFVHLYLSDLSLFQPINEAYSEYFADNPPSRSCVAIPLPPGVLVAIDVLFLFGDALSSPDGSTTRSVLHVRSRSEWAPQCIGPYSQANIVHKALAFPAGFLHKIIWAQFR